MIDKRGRSRSPAQEDIHSRKFDSVGAAWLWSSLSLMLMVGVLEPSIDAEGTGRESATSQGGRALELSGTHGDTARSAA